MERNIPFTVSPNKKDGYLNIVLDKDKAFFFQNFGFSTYLSDKFLNHSEELVKYEKYLDLLLERIGDVFEEKLNEYKKVNIIFPYEGSIFIDKLIKKIEEKFGIILKKVQR